MRTLSAFLVCLSVLAQDAKVVPPYKPSAAELELIRSKIAELQSRLKESKVSDDLLADVAIYRKAGEWILRHPEEFYTRAYYDNTLTVLNRGIARAAELKQGKPSWVNAKGRISRAYRSRVDGSLQPYGLLIPDSYDPAKPSRLDVVLHGRAATMNEVSFLFAHDSPKPLPPDRNHFALEVFGRTNNAYRWAGETDVFEAIESVRKRYNIDPNRIVLRGFSMGGAGTWHIGLHHPDRWVAMEAGAGFVETRNYARLRDVPEYQAKPLSIYDALEYATNAFNLPVVGYGGEDDPQLKASQSIQRAAIEAKADRSSLFLVGPKTAHKWHPESQKKSDAFLNAAIEKGRRVPDTIRFVTYTTQYNQCFWLTIDALDTHYERAEVEGSREALKTSNVAALSLDVPGTPTIDGQQMKEGKSFEKVDGKWRVARPVKGLRKRHGLQGPIDDAFRGPFVAMDVPEREKAMWAKYMRGDLLTGKVSKQDHLVLFGDPETNKTIAKIHKRLPVHWSDSNIVAGSQKFPAAEHTLVMIYPNPLNPERYVVLNAIHSFDERAFKGTNALLYPRYGDWAIVRKSDGHVAAAGIFDEYWKLK